MPGFWYRVSLPLKYLGPSWPVKQLSGVFFGLCELCVVLCHLFFQMVWVVSGPIKSAGVLSGLVWPGVVIPLQTL